MIPLVGALDIGGTHVTAGRVVLPDCHVEVGSDRRLPLAADATREKIVGTLIAAARSVHRPHIRYWGVAVPGPFDYARGVARIRGLAKLEAIYGLDLRTTFAAALGVDPGDIHFLNDAEAFGLGEWRAGASRGHRRCVGITLGTGLGSAFLVDGVVQRAGDGVPPKGRIDLVQYGGRPVEETVSRRALLNRYGARSHDAIDVKDIAELARGGKPVAMATFADTFAALGECLAPLLDRFQASCLVVGGSISGAWDLIEGPLRSALAGLPSLEVITHACHVDHAALSGAGSHAAAQGQR